MISEFLLKGIDNIFQERPPANGDHNRSIFSKETIKRDLSSVIRTKDSHNTPTYSPAKNPNIKKHMHAQILQEFGQKQPAVEPTETSKSRLKCYLEQDRQSKIRSVIRKGDASSKSPIKQMTSPSISYNENMENYRVPRYTQQSPLTAEPEYMARHYQPRKSINNTYNYYAPPPEPVRPSRSPLQRPSMNYKLY